MTCVRREAGAHRPAASAPPRPPSSRQATPRDRSRPDRRGGRARLSLLLPVLALVLGALGLFAPAPAQAQVPVWSATLTVAATGSFLGCSHVSGHTPCSTGLTDSNFAYNSINYEVQFLLWRSDANELSLGISGIDGRQIKDNLVSLRLNVAGREFAVSNALVSSNTKYVYWRVPNPGLTDGQTVKVSLTEGPVAAYGITVSRFRATPHDDRVDLSWRVDHSGFRGQPEYLIWWREAGSTGWNIYTLQSYYTTMRTTIAPREFMTANGCWCTHFDDNPEPLKPGTSYDVRVYVGSGYTTKADALVYATTVTTTGEAPSGSMQLRSPPGSVEPPAPALEWAQVNGAALALRFDKDLDETSAPSASAFAVSVAGASRGVSSVTVSQDMVTLTLAEAVAAGETVTVGYTPPGSGKLRSTDGGEVAAFTGRSVTNDTPSAQPQQQAPPEAIEPPAAAPLTARVSKAPAEHDGSAFAVRIRFSEAVETKAKDAAIRVAGGTLTRAVRLKKRKDLWELRLAPSGQGAVTVTLPAGAARTADGRTLSDAATVTVSGPVALSVADASAREGAGATMDFAVTLSRAASKEVTVRYATRNGTAKKGKDYGKAKGTLAFAAGETSKTVSVAILDDAHDEGAETFRLVLYQAKGAALADGEAVGTIENSDPLQQDWLARFGRAAAADAVAAVTARLETPRDAGSHLTLGGYRLSLDGSGESGLLQDPAGTAPPLRWMSDIGPADGQARTVSGRELLMGTSFRAVLGSGAGSQWTSWGQGASVSQFSSATPSLSLSGETATGSLGMDYGHGRLLTGFAMTHSLGEGTARGSGKSYLMGSSVTTALPYVRYALSERVSAWGLAGTGSGRLTLELGGDAPERYGADLSMTLAATGVRGELVTPAEAGGFALALKADAFWVRTESDSVSTPEAGNLAGARAEASRVRAMLDGSRTFALAGGGTLTPSIELGLRHDGGDAETGTGTEIGAGLGYADPSRGLDMEFRVHGLAGHAEDGYDEWGVSGSLRLVPGAAGRGLSASLTPSYGVDPGGSERLWILPDAHALAANEDAAMSSRLDTEIGYGLGGPAGLGTLTPYAGLGLAGDDARTWRAGARWEVAPDVNLGLEGTLSESAGAAPEHGVMMRSALRW